MGAWGGEAVPPHPGGDEATSLPCPGAGAPLGEDQIDLLGSFLPGVDSLFPCPPGHASSQSPSLSCWVGVSQCIPPLWNHWGGVQGRWMDSPCSAQPQEGFPGLGRLAREEAFQDPLLLFPIPALFEVGFPWQDSAGTSLLQSVPRVSLLCPEKPLPGP